MRKFATDYGESLRSGYALPARHAKIGILKLAEDPLIQGEKLSEQTGHLCLTDRKEWTYAN